MDLFPYIEEPLRMYIMDGGEMLCVVGKNVFDGLVIEFCGTWHRELILA
jgi:hypothetical protein